MLLVPVFNLVLKDKTTSDRCQSTTLMQSINSDQIPLETAIRLHCNCRVAIICNRIHMSFSIYVFSPFTSFCPRGTSDGYSGIPSAEGC